MSTMRCARCHRRLTREPVMVLRDGGMCAFGPVCAERLGYARPDALPLIPAGRATAPQTARLSLIVSRRRIHKPDPRQRGLFDDGATTA